MDEHTALLQQQQQLKKRHVQSGGSSPEQRLSDPPAPSHLGGVTASAAATASVPQQQHALSLEQQQQGSGKAQEHGLGSQRMLVPSDTAWRVLLAAPLALWLVLTGLGILLFRGLPESKSTVAHPLQWFDALFRSFGPLLPLLPLLLRWPSLDLPHWARSLSTLLGKPRRQTLVGGLEASAGELQGSCPAGYRAVAEPGVAGLAVYVGAGVGLGFGAVGVLPKVRRARSTLPWVCLAAYFAIAAARVLLYLVHRAAQAQAQQQYYEAYNATALATLAVAATPAASSSNSTDPATAGLDAGAGAGTSIAAQPLLPPEFLAGWVSDHVFLAASVLACLQLELLCCVSDCVKLDEDGAGMVRSFFAACAFLLSIALTLLVSLDMFYTCRFYHYPTESATAIVAGLALFQVPVLIWLSHVRRSQ